MSRGMAPELVLRRGFRQYVPKRRGIDHSEELAWLPRGQSNASIRQFRQRVSTRGQREFLEGGRRPQRATVHAVDARGAQEARLLGCNGGANGKRRCARKKFAPSRHRAH